MVHQYFQIAEPKYLAFYLRTRISFFFYLVCYTYVYQASILFIKQGYKGHNPLAVSFNWDDFLSYGNYQGNWDQISNPVAGINWSKYLYKKWRVLVN